MPQTQCPYCLRSGVFQPDIVAEIEASDGHFAPFNGESQRQVERRMVNFIANHVLPSLSPGGSPALIVGHGVAIKW